MPPWSEIETMIVAGEAGMAPVLRDLFRLVGVRRVQITDDPIAGKGVGGADLVVVPLTHRGLENLGAIRRPKTSPNPFVPVLAVGADVTMADLQAALQFGAHDVVALPVSVEHVRRRLAQAVFVGRPWIDVASYFGPCRRRVLKAWPHKERRKNSEADRASRQEAEWRAERMLGDG